MSTALAGVAPLLRSTIKHDGRSFLPWIVIVTALSASSVLVYPWVFPTVADRAGLAAAVGGNPAVGLIFGPAFDLSTVDGFNSWRSLCLGGFLTALAVIFALTKTTRGQEDSGQAELLASGVLGRAGRLFSGVTLALAGSLLLGIVSAVVTGLCGGSWGASFLLGATFTATGAMFTAIAAIAAQIGSDARTANSISVAVLGTLFGLRGFSYAVSAPEWTLWVNPLGWMTQTRPATGDHWWPLGYALVLSVVLLAVAFALQARRDFGQGVIAPRPGPAHGKVRTGWQLVLRLNKAPLITWAIAFLGIGVVFGYFATSIEDILASDSAVKQVLAAGAVTPQALITGFLVTVFSLIGIIAAIPGVRSMLKLRSEELEDRVEPLLATRMTRSKYYAANVVLSLMAPAVYVLLAGVVVAVLAAGADIGVGFWDTLWQAAVTIPAVWTITAVSVAVVGARPQVILAAWLGVLASFVLTLLGPTFKLWDSILAFSPFFHIPNVGAAQADWWGLVWVSLVTVFFLAVGFAGFRRRDLAS